MRSAPTRYGVSLLRVLAVAALLAGCSSTAAYEEALNGWVGKHVDQLVEAWGPPQSTHRFEDGRRAVQYTDRTTRYVPPITRPSPYSVRDEVVFEGYARELVCITTFQTDRSGIIRSWKWRGNACAIVP